MLFLHDASILIRSVINQSGLLLVVLETKSTTTYRFDNECIVRDLFSRGAPAIVCARLDESLGSFSGRSC